MKIAALFAFYRNIYWLTWSVTAVTVFLYWQTNEAHAIVPLLWTKVITNCLALVFVHIFQRERLYFFFNLGYGTRQLYTIIFFVDMFIWTVLISFLVAIS